MSVFRTVKNRKNYSFLDNTTLAKVKRWELRASRGIELRECRHIINTFEIYKSTSMGILWQDSLIGEDTPFWANDRVLLLSGRYINDNEFNEVLIK